MFVVCIFDIVSAIQSYHGIDDKHECWERIIFSQSSWILDYV